MAPQQQPTLKALMGRKIKTSQLNILDLINECEMEILRENVLPPDAHLRKSLRKGQKRYPLATGEFSSLGNEEGSVDHEDPEGR